MKSRLNNLSENSLTQRLSRVQQDFDALKANQAFGATSVTLQRVVSGRAYDFSLTSSYQTIQCFEVTYTPTGFVLPNTCYVWKLFLQTPSTSGTGTVITFTELNRINPATGAWTYRFYVQGTTPSATLTMNVLAIFYAMSQGTISVSQIL